VVLEVAEVEADDAAEVASAVRGNDRQTRPDWKSQERPLAQLVTLVRKQRAAFRRMGELQQLVRNHV